MTDPTKNMFYDKDLDVEIVNLVLVSKKCWVTVHPERRKFRKRYEYAGKKLFFWEFLWLKIMKGPGYPLYI